MKLVKLYDKKVLKVNKLKKKHKQKLKQIKEFLQGDISSLSTNIYLKKQRIERDVIYIEEERSGFFMDCIEITQNFKALKEFWLTYFQLFDKTHKNSDMFTSDIYFKIVGGKERAIAIKRIADSAQWHMETCLYTYDELIDDKRKRKEDK